MNNTYTYAKISLKAIADNLRFVKKHLNPGTAVMAVVKSDAYGHGMVAVSEALEKADIDALGVAFVHEGIILRDAGINAPIYVLSGVQHGEEEPLINNRLTPLLYNKEQIKALNSAAGKKGKTIDVHLKIDTGMGRLGFAYDEAGNFNRLLNLSDHLNITGVATHISDAANSAFFTKLQISRFKKVRALLESQLSRRLTAHIANTDTLFNYPESHFDMVRPGISMYGYGREGLTPSMQVLSSLISVKTLKKGYYVSYGRTYRLKHDTKIGVIPIGYADGYSRTLSNKGFAGIHGKKAHIVGRVTMNHTMLNITGLHARIGDKVLIMGGDKSIYIGADVIAEQSSTISYEVLCSLGSSLKHVYE